MLVVNTTNELKLKVKWFCHTAKKTAMQISSHLQKYPSGKTSFFKISGKLFMEIR